jgi:hypothetical protein
MDSMRKIAETIAGQKWSHAAADPLQDLRNLQPKRKLVLHPEDFRCYIDYMRTISQAWAELPYVSLKEIYWHGLILTGNGAKKGIANYYEEGRLKKRLVGL